MAKEFAESFYNSKAWQETRAFVYQKQHGLCERCGKPGDIVHHKEYLTPMNIHNPMVTLGENNLELLCQDCHNREHMRRHGACEAGYAFDENGDLVQSPHKTERV